MHKDNLDIESLLGPHYAVLFRGSKCRPTAQDREEIHRLSQSGVDWEMVLHLARLYDVISLLYYNFKDTAWRGIIPAAVLAKLKDEYAAVCGLNLAYYQELKRLLKIFAERKIKILLLKGAALAQLLYPDMGLRAFGDIDLLIHPEHLGQVDEIMLPDYQLENPLPADRLKRDCYFHLTYKRRQTPALSFEFHWNLYSEEGLIDFDPKRLWQKTKYVEISEVRTQVPSTENLFLHLCLHFSGHSFLSLKDLWDIEWMVSSPNDFLDLKQVVAIAKESGITARVYYSLSFAQQLLGTKIEPWVREAIQPSSLTRKLFPFILDGQKVLHGEAEQQKDVRGVVAFFMYQGKRLRFLKHLLYPGICWLNVYPDEPSANRLKTVLRGIRLLLYITGRLSMSLIRLAITRKIKG